MASGSDPDGRQRQGASSPGRRSSNARRGGGQGSAGRQRRSARSRPRSSTGGAFKLSSTRRAAVLALLVCAMALSVAVPLRTYLSQLDALAVQGKKRTALARQVEELEQRDAQLSDPAYIEAEARTRLGMVRPDETPYIVEAPNGPDRTSPPPAPETKDTAWYEQLWKSLAGKGS